MDSFLKKCAKIDYKLYRDPDALDLDDLSDDNSPKEYRGLSSSAAPSL